MSLPISNLLVKKRDKLAVNPLDRFDYKIQNSQRRRRFRLYHWNLVRQFFVCDRIEEIEVEFWKLGKEPRGSLLTSQRKI